MKTFEFVFEGTQEQYEFFLFTVGKRLPEAHIKLDFIDEADKAEYGKGYNMSMTADARTCFEMGMIVSALYSKFERLQGTIFDNKK